MHALSWKSVAWETRTRTSCFIHTHKEAGANFIGMILWPKSKRAVGLDVAKEISKAARDNGAEPVGVFVDEDANEIQRACDATNITFAQEYNTNAFESPWKTCIGSGCRVKGSFGIFVRGITLVAEYATCLKLLHGNGARSALSSLVQHRNIIYVMHADKSEEHWTKKPDAEFQVLVDWILIDSLIGGSGQSVNWNSLEVPVDSSKNGWLLAGGITPENVSGAISILRPDAVDVSSGICTPDGIRKDRTRIVSFMCGVRRQK